MSETPTPAALRALEAAATPEKPLFADVDWAADRGRGVAQLIGGGGTLLAEFDADRFATFLDMAGDTCDFLGGSEPGVSRLDLPDVAAMRAAIEKAHDHVSDLCEGKTKWTMRIPAEPDRDSDLVIGAGLQAGKKALDRLAAAEQERDRTREQLADALLWVPEHAKGALIEQWKRRASDPYTGPLCRCGHPDRAHQVEINLGHWSPPVHECVACDDCRHCRAREESDAV